MPDTPEDPDLLERLRAAGPGALVEVVSCHRERLRRMIHVRLDSRLHGRVDPSEVIEDACAEGARRLEEYLREPSRPVFLWLRMLVGERLAEAHRRHLGVEASAAGLGVSIVQGGPSVSSAALAAQLLGGLASPTEAAERAERAKRVLEAVNGLEPIDREVLALRHFERLSRAETAGVLGIEEAAAAKRHVLALQRLRAALSGLPGGLEVPS